ncbi:hypothetical protein KFU94_58495 [Chloroflexi bacterium TSY]|nr:hypothetical protein [Chloroflexi bacterium TSY]
MDSRQARGVRPTERPGAGAINFEILVAASGANEDVVANGLDELWRRRIIQEQSINRYDCRR